MAELVPWMIAAAAFAVAFGLYLRVRAAVVETGAATVEAEKLRGELASTREQLSKNTAKQRQLVEDAQELRKKLDKSKRRAAQIAGTKQGGSSVRLPELEAELERTRQARDAALEEASGLSAEVSRLRAATAARPEAPAPLLDNEAIEALQSKCDAAEAALAEARKRAGDHERAVARLEAKLDTQEQLYVSMRGELAAKKDRLRTQQEELERLQALKVAVIDPEPGGSDVL